MLQPSSSRLHVSGRLFHEITGSSAALLYNDPGGWLEGELTVRWQGDLDPGTANPYTPKSMAAVSGGVSQPTRLNLRDTVGEGWSKDMHPSDNFLRILPPPAPPAGVPGLCSDTLHPWKIVSGSFALTTGGSLTAAQSGSCQAHVPAKRGLRGGESRAITANVTLGTSGYDFWIFGQYGNSYLAARLNGNNLYLYVGGSYVAYDFSDTTASTSYVLTLAFALNALGLPTRAQVFLGTTATNGVLKLDYALTAAQTATLGPGVTYPFMEDGIRIADQDGTAVTGFYVRPLSQRDVVARQTYVAVTEAATITLDAAAGNWQTITATDGTAFTLAAPINPPSSLNYHEKSLVQALTVEVTNTSGGAMGVITWNGAFVFAGQTWTNPATSKSRFATFQWNGVNWICSAIAAADY